jgi:hypothetical protein
VRVFYDDYEQATLLGRNLYTYLYEVYSQMCRYCILFVSNAYNERMWTVQERVAAQDRAMKERGDAYLIPLRVERARIPGLSETIAYVSLDIGIPRISDLIIKKLWLTDPDAPKGKIGKWLYEID